MIRVIQDKCQKTVHHMVIVIEADKPDELTTSATREHVLMIAREQGFPARGLNGLPQTYPVDADGNTGEDVLLGRVPVAAHRADYQVNAGMGVV